jgi:Na+/proline symporter
MSSTASELNALGTITALDLYKRNNKNPKDDKHYLFATKGFTLLWGIIAIAIACVASLFDNLIQLVNIIGSIFYGNVLGIFLLAFFFKFVKGNAVFVAAIVTQIIVIIGWYMDWMSYLWLNAFGCVLVIILAFITQAFDNFLGNSPIE